eukprot:scaffold422906_cov114-Attheya_sp.AAC.1
MPYSSASAASAFVVYHSGAGPILSSHFSPSSFLPSSTPLVARTVLLLRAGGQEGLNMLAGGQGAAAAAAAGVVLKDFSGAAAGYFGGVRIPASLIAGSSLGALFSLKGLLDNMEKKSPTERLVIQIYHVMVLISFILSLSTIVVATAATVTIMHGTFDVMAETAYILLRRELEFEFVSSRWAFLMSLFTFLVGVTGRVLLEFDLLTEKRRSLALGVVFSMTAL